jgi:hypothetical protein
MKKERRVKNGMKKPYFPNKTTFVAMDGENLLLY